MKKNKRLFCSLMATGIYEGFRAVETVWGHKYEDSEIQAKYLLDDSKVKARIKLEKKALTLNATMSTVWIKGVLVDVINRASSLVDGDYDPNTIRQSLDMINKMNGNYEKDNQQKTDVSLKMTF